MKCCKSLALSTLRCCRRRSPEKKSKKGKQSFDLVINFNIINNIDGFDKVNTVWVQTLETKQTIFWKT